MGLETGTYVNDLVSTNPVSGDLVSAGDDHLRLIKSVLKNTFPDANRVFKFPSAQITTPSTPFTVVSGDANKLFSIPTSGSSVTVTLPSLAFADAGWNCSFVKVTADTSPIFIVPPSGNMWSGEIPAVTKARRAIPGHVFNVVWNGVTFIVERIPKVPIGTILDNHLGTVPVGYEAAGGQTLASASTNYPDLFAAWGSGLMPDYRGRVGAGMDDMGPSGAANRLATGPAGGMGSVTLGGGGGADRHTLTEAELATHSHSLTANDQQPTFTYNAIDIADTGAGTSVVNAIAASGLSVPITTTADLTVPTSTNSIGSNAAHNNVQPTICQWKIVVVE